MPKQSSIYRVGLTNLHGNPGQRLELKEWQVKLDPSWTNGIETLDAAEASFHVTLQSLHDGILVELSGEVPTRAQCSRCLDPVEGRIEIGESQMFFYPGARQRARSEGDEEWEDIFEVSPEDDIDLEPMLRDAIVLEMGTLPLCRPDCRGLCPDCGQRWEDLPADHHHEVLDPRWAALGGLAAQLREEESDA